MNVLWHSHSPSVQSGYGALTKAFTPRLKQAGYPVTISACYGREGSPLRNREGIVELPHGIDPFGNDVIRAHARYAQADLVLSVLDPDGFDWLVWSSVPWAAWLPPSGGQISSTALRALCGAQWIIAMSHQDEQQLRLAHFNPWYVPPAVDTAMYKPTDRQQAREELSRLLDRELNDDFVVMATPSGDAADNGQLGRLFSVFADFAMDCPQTLLYLHPRQGIDWDEAAFLAMAKRFGIADQVLLAPRYPLLTGLVSTTVMNQLYNAADVFLHLERQGTDLMALAAQSAGCPVIMTENSAEAEVCMVGWKVTEPQQGLAALQASYGMRHSAHGRVLRQLAHDRALSYDINRVLMLGLAPVLSRIAATLRGVRHLPELSI